MGGVFWVGCGWFFFGSLVGGARGRGRDNTRSRTAGSFSLDDTSTENDIFGSGMGSTGGNMIVKDIKDNFFTITSLE